MRKPYILYKRTAGLKESKRQQYYVAFWDPERQEYTRRATGQTSESAADDVARKWLAEGAVVTTQTLYDYLSGFWAADGHYAKSRRLRGHPLAAEYLSSMHSAVTKRVLPWLKDHKRTKLQLREVTAGILEQLVLSLHETGLSARRVNAIRQAVGVPLAEAKRLGLIRTNPMTDVLKLAESKPQREILTLEEARKVLAGKWADERHRLINMLAASTGMRLGECRGLLVEDLVQDGEKWCILVRHNWQDGEGLKVPKWGSVRPVPLPPRLGTALQELAAANPWGNDFVFYGSRRDIPIGKRMVSLSYNAAVIAAGIPEAERRRRGLTFHSWRHWYVAYIRGTIPDHALQALTRHQSEKMLDRYSSVTEEQHRAVTELAGSVLPEED